MSILRRVYTTIRKAHQRDPLQCARWEFATQPLQEAVTLQDYGHCKDQWRRRERGAGSMPVDSVTKFIRDYTWLCAVGCFIAALITGTNEMRDRRAWVPAEAQVANIDDQCHMIPIIPANHGKQSVWGGIVPCADVPAKKDQHAAYEYTVTRARTFALEFKAPDGTDLKTTTDGAAVRLSQDADPGHRLSIDYNLTRPELVRLHDGLRGLQIPIILNIFGICLLGFAWLSHLAEREDKPKSKDAPTGDWLSRVDLPLDSAAGLAKKKPAPARLQPRPVRAKASAAPAVKISAKAAGGFGRR